VVASSFVSKRALVRLPEEKGQAEMSAQDQSDFQQDLNTRMPSSSEPLQSENIEGEGHLKDNSNRHSLKHRGLEFVATQGLGAIIGQCWYPVVLENMDVDYIARRGNDTLNQDVYFPVV
jgi:hypothetical protein